jgi:exoribonuclease-2
LASIEEVTRSFHNWRQAHAAPSIQLPEARIRVVKGEVSVLPVQFGRSRDLVLESMLMVGYGVGRYSIEQGIPMPFSRQEQPELDSFPDTLATMWSARRRYKRSEHTTIPGGHAGLGLPVYIQSTSPLRRFLDLLAHQQLRTVLSGRPPLTSEEVTEYVGGSDIRSAEVKKVERLSDRHFVLAYLIQNPDWTGTGIVVSLGKTTTVVVPDLGLEADLVGRNRYELDDEIQLAVDSIRLPVLQCFFTEV